MIWSTDKLIGNALQSDVNTSFIIFPWLSNMDRELLLNLINYWLVLVGFSRIMYDSGERKMDLDWYKDDIFYFLSSFVFICLSI